MACCYQQILQSIGVFVIVVYMKKVMQARRKKSAEAIVSIQKVQYATEAAMKAVIVYLQLATRPTSEKAHEIIDTVLSTYNCESPEGHIVAGGVHSSEPHEVGNGFLKKHVPIVIDIYPRSKETGYFADMTRTVCRGVPSARLQKMYDVVFNAQKHALSMVKPGVTCIDIQNAVEKFFSDAGYVTSGKGKEFSFAEGFVHGVGHGVGSNIHESPHLGRKSTDTLKEGDVITVEPGLYYKKIGGVRLEDLVLVTKAGHQNLTRFPKKLVI